MKHRYIAVLISLLIVLPCMLSFGSGNDSIYIKDIYFLGLKRSKPQYVQHYIAIKQGTYADSASINKDVQRINNLSQFENTSYFLKYLNDTLQASLFFVCEEIFTVAPVFYFGGSKEDIWFYAGLKELNLFGRGHEVLFVYQYYDKHSVLLDYKIPYLGKSNWGMSFGGRIWTTIEPYYFSDSRVLYNYHNNSFSLATSYEFSYENFIEIEVSPLWESFTKLHDQDSLEGPVRYNRNSIRGRFYSKNSNIKYDYFYMQGLKNSFDLEVSYDYIQHRIYWLAYDEIKAFCRPVPSMNLAGRIRLGYSSNNDSLYAPFVCDDFVNIRGCGSKIYRGTATINLNLELRQTVYENKWAGIQALIFNDSGSWIGTGGDWSDFSDSRLIQSYSGLGLRFILKKAFDTMFRIDYGWDLLHGNGGGLVLGAGQFF